jgi:SHS2 domain-containing protein
LRHYELIPHTADTRVAATGDTLPELFLAALEAMNEVIREGGCTGRDELTLSRTVEISSYDTTALLIDFLSEALTLSHIDNALYCDAEFVELGETALVARLRGVPVDRFDVDVKAVSYSEAEVERDESGQYRTSVVFDI